jgi:hypothetical protein
MAKPLGFWKPCEPKSEYEILGSKERVMLTLRSWGICHHVIWNTGIMSRRTSSSFCREEEVWLPHYRQHIKKSIFFKTLPSPCHFFSLYIIIPTFPKKWFQLHSLWQGYDSPFSVKIELSQFASEILRCCAHVDCIQILGSYMRIEIFMSVKT